VPVTAVLALVASCLVFAATAAAAATSPPGGVSAAAAAATPGYWLVADDGGIFNFGSAAFHGSTGALTLNEPIVGMASTPSGAGYWLVASDGGIFSFGDAQFFGSTGAITLNQDIVGMAATPTGQGYWLVAADGGIFNYGDAQFLGSGGGTTLSAPVIGIAASPSGQGYWLAEEDGTVLHFGDATLTGSPSNLSRPIVGIAATSGTQATIPVVTTAPQDLTVAVGADATFTTAASGVPTPTVQWQVSTDGGTTYTDVAGATSTTLTVASATLLQSGNRYRAVFTNTAGTATSGPATLTVAAAPTLTGASPNIGNPAGGNTVVLTGTGLTGASALTFGSAAAPTFTVDSDTQITATAPASAAGPVIVTVTTPGGTATTAYAYIAVPGFTTIAPNAGPVAGGTSVVITGTDFTGASVVSFGANPATSFTVDSDTQITAVTPAGTAGAVDVSITTPVGTGTDANAFTYAAVPTLTTASPSIIDAAGGATVTITGTGFTGATLVEFGNSQPGTPATNLTVVNDSTITVTAPAGTAGSTVNVFVTTPGGVASGGGPFITYTAAPTVTSLAPASGSTAGGTSVTITGTNFQGVTAVNFGGSPATSFTVNSGTQITATSPAGSVGTVDVTVTNAIGTSATSASDEFTYALAPSLTSLNPTSGTSGMSITITGTNLTGATAVTFAGTPGLFTVDSDTQITVTTPSAPVPPPVSVVVAVTGPGGTSNGLVYTYAF
jgi:hypothetical protein